MAFVLSEEEESIRRSARDFARARAGIAETRRLRDEPGGEGFSRAAWKELAALGLVGVSIGEAHGGAGLGVAQLGLVLEELGRTLAPTPYLSSVVLGAGLLERLGGHAVTEELAAISAGDRLVAVAHDEGTRHRPWEIATAAVRRDDAWVIRGEKSLVLDGAAADALLVVARTAGATGDRAGLSLFRVDPRAPGVRVARRSIVDGRHVASVTLDGVVAPASALLGERDGAADPLEIVLDRARAAISAEMLGGALEAFDRTVAYLRERKQFGVPIGSFQALKHRAAWLFCELELTRSIVRHALVALDEGADDARALASTAKARASDTFLAVAAEGIQMHGGIGVTDEHDIGLFYKRARVAELTFGDAAFHRDRFARLHGY